MKKSCATITSINDNLWERYGNRSIPSFILNKPKNIDSYIFCEEKLSSKLANTIDLKNHIYSDFLINFSFLNGSSESKYNYKKDAIKFCHKSFSIIEAIRLFKNDYEYLFWFDADIVATELFSEEFLKNLLPNESAISYIGRNFTHSETGFLGFNLNSSKVITIADKWESFYSEKILELSGYTDSHIFDKIRETEPDINYFNLSDGTRASSCINPLEKTILGKKFKHFKGTERKELI